MGVTLQLHTKLNTFCMDIVKVFNGGGVLYFGKYGMYCLGYESA